MKQNSIVECVSEDSHPSADFNWYLGIQSKFFEEISNKFLF